MRLSVIAALSLSLLFVSSVANGAESVNESARDVPVVGQADVLILGGTVGAVAAAVEAAQAGAETWLLAPRMYLGEDLCATLRMWRDETGSPSDELVRSLFGEGRTTTPLKVKQQLEAALLEADVRFLFGCFPTDVLLDDGGLPSAVIVANRAGRQAILCSTIIDATQRATVARMAGASVVGAEPVAESARRVVLGGETEGSLKPERSIPAGVAWKGTEPAYHEYVLEVDFGDGGIARLAQAEQQARDATFRRGQLRAAERLTVIWRDPIRGEATAEDWRPGDSVDLKHFQPQGVPRVYVLGPCADVPREEVAQIFSPDGVAALGRRIGRAAAEQSRNPENSVSREASDGRPTVAPGPELAADADAASTDGSSATTAGKHPSPRVQLRRASRSEPAGAAEPGDAAPGDVREVLQGLRPSDQPKHWVAVGAGRLPVLAEVDVVIVGGGTSGSCAAIGAGRAGARALVVEYQEGLGGVGTVGLITRPYHGRNEGFTREVPFPDERLSVEDKMEWFRREIRKTGGQIWFGVLGCGAYVDGSRVRGAVVASESGRGVVLAPVVIDATGSADVAIAAGADWSYGGDAEDIALQGTGLPMRPLGAAYVNTDYLLVDEADALDTWRALVGVRLTSNTDAYDIGSFIQNRERRRVVGDHVLAYLDQIAERTYPDSIVLSASDYDAHGYPSDVYFALIPHTEKTRRANHPAPGGSCYTPYRCLLPAGLEGILVTGLGISMQRDASAMVRMQKDMHNQGYAAGYAAALAVRAGCTPREIDVHELQRHLVEIGNLPESVLTDRDSFPLSEAVVEQAVQDLGDPSQDRGAVCRALAIVLSHPQTARPLLKRAHSSCRAPSRIEYAKVLGVLGDREVVPELLSALERSGEWDDKIFQGSMAEYAHLPTPLDALILALGYAGDRSAVPAILKRLETLDASVTLSHHRSVALALERLADPAAAEPLARLLQKPGMRGHAMPQLERLYDRVQQRRRREGPLREIVLARALYRCGDHQGLGETILREYQQDLRGLFARHAQLQVSGQAEPPRAP